MRFLALLCAISSLPFLGGCSGSGTPCSPCQADAPMATDATCPQCPACDVPDGGPTDPGSTPDSGSFDPGLSDAGDAAPQPGYCPVWDHDFAPDNLVSLRRFALSRSGAVVEGTLGPIQSISGQPYVKLKAEKVLYGWSFLEGLEALISLPPGILEANPGVQSWIVGLSGSYPTPWDVAGALSWGSLATMIPKDGSGPYADLLGFREDFTTHVAVVRIVEQDDYRTTFEVVSALKGTFPKRFSDNWYKSWGLPYPPKSPGTNWIASLHGLTKYPDGSITGSIVDFRPGTPDQVSSVKVALAQPVLRYDKEALKARRDEYRSSFAFHRSNKVVSTVVTGLAEECCTGLGGLFVQHGVAEYLKGGPGPDRIVTGGHGYGGQETCGAAFLIGLDTIQDEKALPDPPFGCLEYPDIDSWDAQSPEISSPVRVQAPDPGGMRDRVFGWVTASPPVFRLLGTDTPVPSLEQDPANAPWSLPVDAVEAFLLGTHAVLFVVEDAVFQQELGYHLVTISTTFSLYEYEHLKRYSFRFAFRCGDPRLLVKGSRWIGAMVVPGYAYPGLPPEPGQAFLVPGTLVPEWGMTGQLASALEYFW